MKQLQSLRLNPYNPAATNTMIDEKIKELRNSERFVQWTDADGNRMQTNTRTGQDIQIRAATKPEKPDSLTTEEKDFEYGKTHPDFQRRPVLREVIGPNGEKTFQWFTPPKPGETHSTQPTPYRDPIVNDDNVDLHGDEYLKTIDPKTASRVRAVQELREPFPTVSSRAARGNANKDALDALNQAYPGYDIKSYQAAIDTNKEFNNTKSQSAAGAQVKTADTLIGHLSSLSNSAEDLGNGASDHVNQGMNAATKVRGSGEGRYGKLAKFREDQEAVAGELTRLYSGNQGADAHIQRVMQGLSESAPLGVQRKAIAEAHELLMSRVDALHDQYSRGYGAAYEKLHPFMIPPERLAAGQELVQRRSALGDRPDTQSSQSSTQAAPPGPPPPGKRWKWVP